MSQNLLLQLAQDGADANSLSLCCHLLVMMAHAPAGGSIVKENQENRHLSIVTPVLNEEAQINEFVKSVNEVLAAVPVSYTFLFIDDGSVDGTWNQILGLRAENPNVSAIRLSRHFGKEAALSAGLEASTGDAVVVMDVDLQHPPKLLPEMIRLWSDGSFKVVEGRKVERGREAWTKRIAAKAFYALIKRSTGFDLDGATDFKLLDRTVVDTWKSMPERVTFFRGMCAWMGFEPAVVVFSVPSENCRPTQWNVRQLIRLAFDGITAFTSVPLHIVTILGILFFIFSILLGAQTLYIYFSGRAVDGFTTVILLLLMTGSGILMGLGVIGVYIARIFNELKARPRYVIIETLSSDSPGDLG